MKAVLVEEPWDPDGLCAREGTVCHLALGRRVRLAIQSIPGLAHEVADSRAGRPDILVAPRRSMARSLPKY